MKPQNACPIHETHVLECPDCTSTPFGLTKKRPVSKNRMAEWAKKERARLRFILKERCNACGSTENLEFDCITPRGNRHHKMSTGQRMCFYRREFRLGNVQLLCSRCNQLKADGTFEELLALLNSDPDLRSSITIIKACEQSEQLRPSVITVGIHANTQGLTHAWVPAGREGPCE